MKQELVILDDDKLVAQARIAELQQQIQDLGPEFYEVFNQSSETWHDNAPFDALRDRQSALDAELQQLRTTLRNSAISVLEPKKGRVGIGSRVCLANGSCYFIAGDWTPYAGQMKNDATVISRKAPLATELLNKKKGDEVWFGQTSSVIETVQ